MSLHRGRALIIFVLFVAALLFILSPSRSAETLSKGISEAAKYGPKLPDLTEFYPFRPNAHAPPEEQKNSTSGESKWYSDWTWLLPFSSSITLDENRSVLPPLPERPAVYTYYDAEDRDDKVEQDADARLLRTWRKAWYAQGFRPVILTRGEAMNNQLYEAVLRLPSMTSDLEKDMFRWLAWGNMGTGLLADWRCFPMGKYNDPVLTYLRRQTIPTHITHFDRLESGLFAGEKARINDAIKTAIKNVTGTATSVLDLISPDLLKTEQPSALAFYSSSVITSQYPVLAEKLVQSPTEGRQALAELINAHLHNTFLDIFSSGIAVLKPFPENTTALVEPTLRLAQTLTQCPNSSIPASCPPNLPKCHTCGAGKPLRISQPPVYKNASYLYTIGTLPHPYTLISLQLGSDEVTTRHIRRETDRDPWLKAVTLELLGPDVAGLARVSTLKDAVAGDAALGSSLWLTVEALPSKAGDSLPSELLDELEWHFGFHIPREDISKPQATESLQQIEGDPNPAMVGIDREYALIQHAREVMKSKDTNRINIKDVAEAWNLADTEIWRFVRAYRARSVVEREKWEDEEKNFIGAKPAS